MAKVLKGDDAEDKEWLQVVWGEVYAPNIPDSGKDFMRPETIREMAYNFMRSRRNGMIDLMHNNKVVEGCCLVESFIARKGDPDFIEGAWVVAVYIADEALWQDILDNKYNGFSLEAWAYRETKEYKLSFNKEISGTTSFDDGHEHTFKAYFDDDGNFLGGQTDDTLGHSHSIVKGTVTETVNNHAHKFAIIDGFGAGVLENE